MPTTKYESGSDELRKDIEIAAAALVAFFGLWGFIYLVFILPELLGGLL